MVQPNDPVPTCRPSKGSGPDLQREPPLTLKDAPMFVADMRSIK